MFGGLELYVFDNNNEDYCKCESKEAIQKKIISETEKNAKVNLNYRCGQWKKKI